MLNKLKPTTDFASPADWALYRPVGFVLPRLTPRPAAVTGCATVAVDLNGTWKFHPAPPAEFAQAPTVSDWSDIRVPGRWVNQGFRVEHARKRGWLGEGGGRLPFSQFITSAAAGYFRSFRVPGDWAGGKRIILRCDAIHSDAVVWVNGAEVGRHMGVGIPFEMDITAAVKLDGDNTLAISVRSESEADELYSGFQFAHHQQGGIARKIGLFVVPETRLTTLQAITTFDPQYEDATLELDAQVEGGEATLLVSVAPLSPSVQTGAVRDFRARPGKISIPVAHPAKWDPEHPNLYLLTVKVEVGGKTVETVTQKIGFRQIEIRGNEMFVNGQPVKLRGCCYQEVHPLDGRTLPQGLGRRDIELFREGNANVLRTMMCSPDEELLDAADELGMFIQCPAPFCWAGLGFGHTELVCRQTAEMALAYRNHPSILFWSLANETMWGTDWYSAAALLASLDPSRPRTFEHDYEPGDPLHVQFLNMHYPGHSGPALARQGRPQPIWHGEEILPNGFNHTENVTDPGLRDQWGRYLRELWDDIYTTNGDLGEAIYAGLDEIFHLYEKETVGEGESGILDGWRREKPEYWHVKKAYSPIRLARLAASGNALTFGIENRYLFTNLTECRIAWKLGAHSGEVCPDIPPGGAGEVAIHLPTPPVPGERLELTLHDPRGFVADRFAPVPVPLPPTPVASPVAKAEWTLDEKTGLVSAINGQPVSGPHLMILPLSSRNEFNILALAPPAPDPDMTKFPTPFTAPCTGWNCSKVTRAGEVLIVEGTYNGVEGRFTYASRDGFLEIAYEFTVTQPVNPRQIGLVFTLPRDCDVLTWERVGYWDLYPDDHIGRLKGRVAASESVACGFHGPRTQPSHPWRLDSLPYGNKDFCSTKHGIIAATIADAAGRGILIDGQGRQHVRCWRTDAAVHVLVADYSNGGAEGYMSGPDRGLTFKDERPLKPGDKVGGVVRIAPLPHRLAIEPGFWGAAKFE